MTEKVKENRLRMQLAKQGFKLKKLRSNSHSYHNGCYCIVSIFNNTIAAGENFDLTFEDVEKFIKE